jgi:5-methylcytosine-specific restriction endonuclease McrA
MITQRYRDYITGPKWQAKRQAYFRKYGKRCQACYSGQGPIHVHHMDYARLGNEHLTDLCGLCVKCHREVTAIYRKNRRRGLRRVTLEFVRAKRSKHRK